MDGFEEIRTELSRLWERMNRLEESRTADVISVKELSLQVKELEVKVETVASTNRSLSSSVESLRIEFQELYRGLAQLGMRVATVDERSQQHEKQNGERYERIQNQMDQMNDKLDRIVPTPQTKSWYSDPTKIKELAAAIALMITMVMGMVNAQKIDQLPEKQPVSPVQVDINTGESGK